MNFLYKAIYAIFPFLTGLTFFLVFLETYSYIGFLRKYLLVDSLFFIIFTLVAGLFIFPQTIRKQNFLSVLNRLSSNINCLVFPVLLIAYLVMLLLESARFHNFVFSTYHLQPANFIYLVILSGCLILLSKLKTPVIKMLAIHNSKVLSCFLKTCILSVLTFLLVDNYAISINQAMGSNIYILLHSQASYDQKMQNYWGFFYEYLMFVKDNTPENSTIMIPPQKSPWLSTGNRALVRYFLYPRNLVQGTDNKSLDLSGVDYVFIAWGEWTDADAAEYGWPKAKVGIEKQIYFSENKNWGIIKIRK